MQHLGVHQVIRVEGHPQLVLKTFTAQKMAWEVLSRERGPLSELPEMVGFPHEHVIWQLREILRGFGAVEGNKLTTGAVLT